MYGTGFPLYCDAVRLPLKITEKPPNSQLMESLFGTVCFGYYGYLCIVQLLIIT